MDSESLGALLSLFYDILIFLSSFAVWLWFRCCKLDTLPIGAIPESESPPVADLTLQSGSEMNCAPLLLCEGNEMNDNEVQSSGREYTTPAVSARCEPDFSRRKASSMSGLPTGGERDAFCENDARGVNGNSLNKENEIKKQPRAIEAFEMERGRAKPRNDSLRERVRMLMRVLKLPEEELQSRDVVIYLESIKSAFKLMCILSVGGMVVLLPIYVNYPSQHSGSFFSRINASVVNERGTLLVLALFTILFAIGGFYFVFDFWANFTKNDSVLTNGFAPKSYTLQVTGLAKECYSVDMLFNHFEALFPNKVVAAHIFKKRIIALDGDYIPGGPRLVLPNTYCANTVSLEVGFVSFTESHCLEECIFDPRIVGSHFEWSVEPACAPHDIQWKNFHLSKVIHYLRWTVLNAVLVLISFVWIPPVSAQHTLPWSDMVDKALLKIGWSLTVGSWLVPLYVYIINSLLQPFLIDLVSIYSGYWQHSAQQSYVTHANHVFLLLNTLIIPVVSISASVIIKELREFREWSAFLWVTLQSSATLTYQYVVNVAFVTTASQLLQFPVLAMRVWDRINRRAPDLRKWKFSFGYWYAFNLSILTVTFVYSVFFPLILIWAMLFFFLKYCVDKYNFCAHVWDMSGHNYDENSTLAMRYFVFSIGLLELCMAGFFLQKNERLSSLVAVMFFTLAWFTWTMLFCRQFVLNNKKRILELRTIRDSCPPAQGKDLDTLKTAYLPNEDVQNVIVFSKYGDF